MKKYIIIIGIPLILTVLGFTFLSKTFHTQENDKKKVLEQVLFYILQEGHFNTQKIDDNYSEKAFDQYIKQIDVRKQFFLQTDIDTFKNYRKMIDDELNFQADVPLYDLVSSKMALRIQEAKGYFLEAIEKPFDFSIDETYQLNPDKRGFPPTKEAMKEYWRKTLKYQAIVRFATKIDEREALRKTAQEKGEPFEGQSDAEIEIKIRGEIKRTYNDFFSRLEKIDDDDRLAEYCNALISVYCPHTEYYPPQEKQNFDMQMSGKLEGIGAQLTQSDGVIKVEKIIPGSPSWKQKELKEGDIILKVGQADEEPVSVTDMLLKDAVSLIRGKKGTEVRLTVKKPDGVITVIPIIRDVVILEETYAKSAVIERNNTKYGYIYLPSFYADFNRSGGRNCGDDIRIELEKLKAQKVEAVILDLRFNGGGSLEDVVKMVGWFIKKGPVVQVKDRYTPAKVYEDTNPSVVYEGPLAVMVNEFSASASEILAGAIQDYQRGVIVGSNTYGKGTVQRFSELDMFVPKDKQHVKPLGSLKYTIQKFYRITGKSTQEKGVTPDIILPDAYEELDNGEKFLPHALTYDEIGSSTFATYPAKNFKINDLASKSSKRIKKDPIFKLIKENAERLKKQKDNTEQSLLLATYRQQQQQLKAESEKYKNLTRENSDLTIFPIDPLIPSSLPESTRTQLVKDWHKTLKQDVYIYETINVLDDLMGKKQ
jgi:carboxyl-terminal processing protease